MSDYRIETKCIQSGYEPKNGEPRILPIYQSTTFKYSSSEQMGSQVTFIPGFRIRLTMRWRQRSATLREAWLPCSHHRARRRIFMPL